MTLAMGTSARNACGVGSTQRRLIVGVLTLAVALALWVSPAWAQDGLRPQTDRALLIGAEGLEVVAFEWWTFLELPRTEERNECDGPHNDEPCIWFVAGQVDIGLPSGAKGPWAPITCRLHVGPIVGAEHAMWNINHGQYCGDPTKKKPSDMGHPYHWNVEVPVGQWLRFKVERSDHAGDPQWFALSLWRIVAEWGGRERIVTPGQLSFGDRILGMHLWVELQEVGDVCRTDFVGARFMAPRYWTTRGGPFTFSEAIITYQEKDSRNPETCNDTNFGSPLETLDYLVDERGVDRRQAHDTRLGRQMNWW